MAIKVTVSRAGSGVLIASGMVGGFGRTHDEALVMFAEDFWKIEDDGRDMSELVMLDENLPRRTFRIVVICPNLSIYGLGQCIEAFVVRIGK